MVQTRAHIAYQHMCNTLLYQRVLDYGPLNKNITNGVRQWFKSKNNMYLLLIWPLDGSQINSCSMTTHKKLANSSYMCLSPQLIHRYTVHDRVQENKNWATFVPKDTWWDLTKIDTSFPHFVFQCLEKLQKMTLIMTPHTVTFHIHAVGLDTGSVPSFWTCYFQ